MAVYGGSFNPPHVGHVLAVTYALSTMPVDQVLVVPCFLHPFAKELASFEDRFRMCQRAMAFHPRVTVSRVEADLGGESRTLRTLEHLCSQHSHWDLRLLIGADILVDAPKWHGFARVKELAPLLILGRVGVERDEAPPSVLPQVSSTDVRTFLATGQIDRARSLVPGTVLDFIEERGLYRSAVGE